MSRVYRSRMAGVQHSARRRKASEQEAFMDDPRMCRGGKEELTGWEKQQWKVGCFEVREKAGVVASGLAVNGGALCGVRGPPPCGTQEAAPPRCFCPLVLHILVSVCSPRAYGSPRAAQCRSCKR